MGKAPHINISDGSSFPLAIPTDPDEHGLEWRLRYAPDSIERGDLLHLASIVSSYNYLIYECDRTKRDLVARDMRRAFREATDEQ